MFQPPVRSTLRRGLTLGAAFVTTALTPFAASAQDATWVGIGNNFNAGANWTPTVTPTNRATMSATGVNNISIASPTTLNQIRFDATAQSYSISNFASLTINGIGGIGVENLSANLQTITNANILLTFNNASVVGGTGGVVLVNQAAAPNTHSMVFNGTSSIDADVTLINVGGNASGVGIAAPGGGSGNVTFSGSSSADGAQILSQGGSGTGTGAAAGGTGSGGTATISFDTDAHADGATFQNQGGNAAGVGATGAASFGSGVGGTSAINFADNAHADNATFSNIDGSAAAIGGSEGASGFAVGGVASVNFSDAAHADGATFNNTTSGGAAIGGNGTNGTPGTGLTGGNGVTNGGFVSVTFSGTSHADNAIFTNAGGSVTAIGGNGGAGTTSAGGTGGIAAGNNGTIMVSFAGDSHANGATITNDASAGVAFGGIGGNGGSTAVGGTGGAATSGNGGIEISFNGNSQANGATIVNNAGDGFATGGTGGVGGSGAAGGVGGTSNATGANALIQFSGNSTAGTGTTIVNQGGDGDAIGGAGGAGGTGAGGNGGTGGAAQATGGTATISFIGSSSAGNAIITNTAGTASILSGDGGNGNVGNGGTGGTATAAGGDAVITFLNNSTAGSATIQNNRGTTITATAGTAGTAGAGGGSGGNPGGGSVSTAAAIISFGQNATGGSAHIENNGGTVTFSDASVFGTAAGAQITNQGFGSTTFSDTASLGSGAIINSGNGSVSFTDASTAGSGTITNLVGGFTTFIDTATAGSATINNGGFTQFGNNSTMGSATVNNNAGGTLSFNGASDGVAGTVINAAGGQVSINVNAFRLGSLSGDGTVSLGANALQVGYLDRNETFSGVISGVGGSLVKRGTGTLTLTGTNTYDGDTAVEAGTLQIGNGGTSGSVAGNIVDNANVTFNRSDNVTFANVISGTGSLTKVGAGTLTLTNTNTYGGGTTISAGSLQIGDGGATGSIVGNVTDNANLTFNRSNTVQFSGIISGTGTLTKLGGGLLVLDGNNTYTGLTTISAGTLQIGANGTTGAVAGNILNNSFLTFFRSDDYTYSGAISGTGGVFKNGNGTLTLTGASTDTGTLNVGNGIVRIGNGGTTGSWAGSINVGPLGVLVFNRSDTLTYGGVISGSGGLAQNGPGTLILTGASTINAPVFVNFGTLQLDGSLGGGAVVQPTGRITGTGTFNGGLQVNGVVAPGNAANPLGTLTATGAATFNAGSFLQPTINAGGQSSLLSAGSLMINGGSVRPTAVAGGVFFLQSDYRIAVGTGGRTGTFGATVDESLLPSFLDASLFYTGTEVFLRVKRNATTFAATTGLTANEAAIGGALDAAVVANNPAAFTTYLGTYNTLLPLSGTQLQAALDTLSGDALTAFPVAAQEHANRFADRLNAYTWSNSSNLWGLIAYGDQDGDSDGNGPGFNAKGVELQMGFNTSLGHDTRLGLSIGMNNGDISVDDRLTTGNVDSWSLGAQLRHDFGQIYVSGQFTYSWHSIDSARPLLQGGVANADYDANTWTAGGELGWVIQTGQLSIEPHLSIRHASTSTDAYSETGPVGALDVVAEDYNTTRYGIGLRLANRTVEAPVKFYALVRYEHESGDEQSALDSTLPGLPTFRTVGTRLGDNILSGEVGAEFRVSGGLSLFMAGGGHTRSNETSVQGNAGLRVRF